MADRVVTVSGTCGVSDVTHQVAKAEVIAAGRHGHLLYRAICGHRFLFAPAAVTWTSQPCPHCAALLTAARQPGRWWRQSWRSG